MPSDQPRPADRPKRMPPEARRRHLEEAALAVFSSQGYAGTDLGDVAAMAGVGRPLVYHYFPDGKRDLYIATLQLAWGRVAEHLTVDPERGAGVLPRNLATYLDLVEAGDPAVKLVRQAGRLEDERIRSVVRTSSAALARGIASNQIGEAHPSPGALAPFLAFLQYFDALLEQMLLGMIDRSQVERAVVEVMPAVARAAGSADAAGD